MTKKGITNKTTVGFSNTTSLETKFGKIASASNSTTIDVKNELTLETAQTKLSQTESDENKSQSLSTTDGITYNIPSGYVVFITLITSVAITQYGEFSKLNLVSPKVIPSFSLAVVFFRTDCESGELRIATYYDGRTGNANVNENGQYAKSGFGAKLIDPSNKTFLEYAKSVFPNFNTNMKCN